MPIIFHLNGEGDMIVSCSPYVRIKNTKTNEKKKNNKNIIKPTYTYTDNLYACPNANREMMARQQDIIMVRNKHKPHRWKNYIEPER